MPRMTSQPSEDRTKKPEVKSCFNAVVTRPVTRKEMLSTPKAMEAFMKAWKGVWDQEVFDFSKTREYDDIANEAKHKEEKIHMAPVHGLIHERNYQLKENDPARKFEGRGVLLGDQVKDQHLEAALFQDLGNSPVPLVHRGGRTCMGGLPVRMCKWRRPFRRTSRRKCTEFHAGSNYLMKRGIHPRTSTNSEDLSAENKALYGHPDGGTMWEQRCHTAVQKVESDKPHGRCTVEHICHTN